MDYLSCFHRVMAVLDPVKVVVDNLSGVQVKPVNMTLIVPDTLYVHRLWKLKF